MIELLLTPLNIIMYPISRIKDKLEDLELKNDWKTSKEVLG